MPLHYQIIVSGNLTPNLTASFEGADIRTEAGTTILTGSAIDRAQLDGILDRLRALGIEVVSFAARDIPPRAHEPETGGSR